MEKNWKVIRVSSRIKPIPYLQRTPVPLKIGDAYYVSFRNGQAHHCRLVGVNQTRKRILVEVPVRPWKVYVRESGYTCLQDTETYGLYADEIGRTPEEAVLHQVTL